MDRRTDIAILHRPDGVHIVEWLPHQSGHGLPIVPRRLRDAVAIATRWPSSGPWWRPHRVDIFGRLRSTSLDPTTLRALVFDAVVAWPRSQIEQEMRERFPEVPASRRYWQGEKEDRARREIGSRYPNGVLACIVAIDLSDENERQAMLRELGDWVSPELFVTAAAAATHV